MTQEQLEYLAAKALADGHVPPAQCYACGKPAERLCDGIVSIALAGSVDDDDMIRTCDRPMCNDHIAHTEGPIFFCKINYGEDSESDMDVDTHDFCEQCRVKQVNNVRPERHVSKTAVGPTRIK